MSDRSVDSEEAAVLGRLSALDRFLPVWIIGAMILGLLLGRMVPGLQGVLDSVQVDQTSLPIAIGLFAMMYPVLARVRYEDMGIWPVIGGCCGCHWSSTGSSVPR